MILLLGGTTEAKEVARWLEDAGLPYIYSTKSKIPFEGRGAYRFGPLNAAEQLQFCQDHKIKKVINASHPFAAELHRTVAALGSGVPLIRFERLFPQRVTDPLVSYVEDYDEALQLFEKQEISSLLVLAGVQSIPRLRTFWEKNTAWFRILDRQESKDLARSQAFPEENLLFGYPQNKEEEILLLRALKPGAILTKESGFNGKLPDKIAAAICCRTPIFILKKPQLSAAYQVVDSREELFKLLEY